MLLLIYSTLSLHFFIEGLSYLGFMLHIWWNNKFLFWNCSYLYLNLIGYLNTSQINKAKLDFKYFKIKRVPRMSYQIRTSSLCWNLCFRYDRSYHNCCKLRCVQQIACVSMGQSNRFSKANDLNLCVQKPWNKHYEPCLAHNKELHAWVDIQDTEIQEIMQLKHFSTHFQALFRYLDTLLDILECSVLNFLILLRFKFKWASMRLENVEKYVSAAAVYFWLTVQTECIFINRIDKIKPITIFLLCEWYMSSLECHAFNPNLRV